VSPPSATTAAARTRPAVRRVAKAAPPKARAAVKQRPAARPAAKKQAASKPRRPAATRPTRSRGGRAAIGRGSRGHRRVSGPARVSAAAAAALPQLPALPRLRPLPVIGTIGSHAFRVGRGLPDSRLLDRLLRGRVWIGLLAVLLFGLVFLNVSLLRMNSAAGHNAEQVKELRIQNDRLNAKVSRLQGGDRLDRVAGRLGLVMPEPGSVHYLSARQSDAEQAARALRGGRRDPASTSLEGIVPATPAGDIQIDPLSTGTGTGISPVAPVAQPTQTQPTTTDPAVTQPAQTQAVQTQPTTGTQPTSPVTQPPTAIGGAGTVGAPTTTP
jgi:hypothetical protein